MKKTNKDKIYWTIGEVGAIHGVPPHTVRWWLSYFGWQPKRISVGGVRYFDMGEVMKIQTIHKLLKVELYTLAGAKRQLELNNENL